MKRNSVIVIGGSVAGMTTALALSEDGHRVTLLEKENLPDCATPVEAFERWERRGSPQSHHSHAFLARLHNDIRRRTPGLYDEMLGAGAEQWRFHDIVRQVFEEPVFEPEDDEIVLLACRRITFDWVLRRHLLAAGRVEMRDGAQVEGLEAVHDQASGLPRVTGVRIKGADGTGETLAADLVVDASGRRTKFASWLCAIGARQLREESEPCGIFYCSRFYRLHDGVDPPPIEGPIGADLGYMKYAIFPGDSRIFSVTLAASPDDAPMRAVLRSGAFDAAAGALPATRAWIDGAVSEPLTDVYAFADLKNTLRFFVDEGDPLALGFQPVGDALVHANPISGRGCTLSWLGAWTLAATLREHSDDPRAFARALNDAVVRDLVPWYENMRDQDREAMRVSQVQSSGEDPFRFQREDGSIEPKAYMRSLFRDGLVPALREDLVVLRAFLRIFNMLDSPSDVMANPDVMQRVLAVWQRRETRERVVLGPGRDEMVERLKAVAA